MAAPAASPPTLWTVADLLETFGPISAYRIRHDPAPGTATVQDVIAIHDRENRLCELVDGVLVEKIMAFKESCLAVLLAGLLRSYVVPRKLGVIAGEGGMMEMASGLVRIPDVSFVSWRRFPNRRIPDEPVPNLAPDLAVEVLSPGNTKKERERKLQDYFDAGVLLVWFVDPRKRTVKVYTSPDQFTLLRQNQTLDGGAVLPGFSLPLRELFAELD
jgi:Uma2 family endonuclease